MVVYTHATWHVTPGKEEEFIAAWNAMGPVFQATCEQPVEGTLLRRKDDPSCFVSFGAWPDDDAVARMRADGDAAAAVAKALALCQSADPGAYDVIEGG